MTRTSIVIAAAAIALLPSSMAFADCAADIAALRANDMTATGSTTADGKTTNFDAPSGSAAAPSTGPIIQDGSVAPLGAAETASEKPAATSAAPVAGGGTTTAPGAEAAGGAVSKDGSTAPLSSAAGGNDPQVATSGQDAEAQQSGMATAASGASTGAALEEAQKASDAGDEEACLKALQAVQG